MAITQDYVSWSTGNDYKGATFTDGAYTSATKTLVKANAFAATKVNHWLYLESNDGGSIVAGYYKIATWTDASTVILATDAGAGVDDDAAKCTQHDGSTSLPWRTDQGACDLLTRNTSDGNQINIKAGTAVVHTATLDLTTLIAGGALAYAAPLILRGYTATANDGGIGEIDAGGATFFAAATYDYVQFTDLKIHNFGNNDGIVLDTNARIFHSEIYAGVSTPSSKALLKINGEKGMIAGCHLHDPGTSGSCLNIAQMSCKVFGNYINTGAAAGSHGIYNNGVPTFIDANIILCGDTGAYGIRNVSGLYIHVFGNIIYNTAAGTTKGIDFGAIASREGGVVVNNIVIGWSGAGGIGISGAGNVSMFGYNAYYNNTTAKTITDQTWYDLTANDVALAADPFTDAANGDFSLTAAAKTALAAKGFPLAYLGAHANTVPNLNIGPIQLAASSGGGGVNMPRVRVGH